MFKFRKRWLALIGLIGGGIYLLYPDRYPNYPNSDHYSSTTAEFFNAVPENKMNKFELMTALWQMVFHQEKFMPTAPLPTQQPNFSSFLNEAERAKFIWFGHSSLLARIASKTIFIDPVFADYASPIPLMAKRFQPPPARLEQLPEVDLIVLSHNHYDHLDYAVISHYKLQKTRFIVPLGVGVLLQKWGIEAERIQELDWWQSIKINGLELFSVPARHNTGRGIFDHNKTLWSGYVFKTETEQFYYSGDSSWGNGEHFKQIATHFGRFDIAFVENGQYNPTWIDNHLLPEQTADVIDILKPVRFMPIHWGAYALSIHPWREPVQKTIPLVEQKGIQTLTPLLGQVFDSQSKTEHWWHNVK